MVQVVRFCIDFPDGASRNDVSLPAGRVFCSCALFDGGAADTLPPELLREEFVRAPGGAQLLARGGLSVLRNDARNLFGALGDTYFILGKFKVSPAPGGSMRSAQEGSDSEIAT